MYMYCIGVVSGRLLSQSTEGVRPEVCVSLPGGDVFVRWNGTNPSDGQAQDVTLIGPAVKVFQGTFNIPTLV